MNGLKLNTGTITVLLVLVFKQMGIAESEAATLAANIILGGGAVIAVVGYIHRIIKARKK